MRRIVEMFILCLLATSCANTSSEQQLADILPNLKAAASNEICIYNNCTQKVAREEPVFYVRGGFLEIGGSFRISDYQKQTCKTFDTSKSYDIHFDGKIWESFKTGDTAILNFVGKDEQGSEVCEFTQKFWAAVAGQQGVSG